MRIVITRQTVIGALAGMTALGGIGGTMAAIEAFRFWAPRGEFEAVAERVYERTSEMAEFQRRRAEAALKTCRASEEARCWSEERDLRKATETYETERARYKSYKGE